MNMIDESCAADPAFTNKRKTFKTVVILSAAVALMLWGAGSILAVTQLDFTWIHDGGGDWGVNGNWQLNQYDWFCTNAATCGAIGDDGCRITNFVYECKTNLQACGGVNTNIYPGFGGVGGAHSAYFTNAGAYTVSMNVDLFDTRAVGSNVFANAADTTATVTLDLNGFGMSVNDTFSIATKVGSTTTVILTNATPLTMNNSPNIGVHGDGTLTINAGNRLDDGAGSVNLGTGDNGRGHLWVTGPGAQITPNSQMAVGNDPQQDPAGSEVIITNGGFVYCNSSFRLGGSSGKGGSSNNVLVVENGSSLETDSGPMTIGLRSTGITNVDGGTLCFNNILIVKNGALWRCANTSSKSVCVGDANLFGLSQTALPLNPTNYARAVTGNCIRIEQGGVVTGASTVWISPSNRIELLGGQFSASMISNKGGLFKGWGLQFAHSVTNLTNYTYDGGVLYPLSSQGTLIISNTSVVIETNGIMQIELGTNTSVNATQWKMGPETTNAFLHIKGTLQFTNPPGAGAVAPGKYRLIAYSPTNALGAPWNNSVRYSGSIGLPLPDPSFGYSISSNVVGNIGYINLDVLRFEVTSIVRQAGTNVVLTWTGPTNAVYRVQATAGGNYSTNSFADISADVSSTSPVNSYTETNGTSAGANRYYRVRIKP